MKTIYISKIKQHTNCKTEQINAVINLLNEGCTIPFISRYRKEATQELDEISINEIAGLTKKFNELEKRKQSILTTIDELGQLTNDLKAKIENTTDATLLEDIYLPYKPKRRTRATIAKEQGLEPLAKQLMAQHSGDIELIANKYLTDTVNTAEIALQGARDIMAEWISENQHVRRRLRNLFEHKAVIYATLIKGKAEEAEKYKDYFDFYEPLKKCPSHRMLAIRRGEAEKFLNVAVYPDKEDAIALIEEQFIKGYNHAAEQVRLAINDSYKRLIQPSLENEFKKSSKEKADQASIEVFAKNLRQLLLASPLGAKRVLALDPGFRTGCKTVCLNEYGDLLHFETIYPNAPQNDFSGAAHTVSNLVSKFGIQAIGIGNGTASRETNQFIKALQLPNISVFMVNESGASIYSASEIARDEFPDKDVTVRGAVSIGRRLIDPLAELVKIDPKSIGVGQYQHDVDQTKLKENLDFVVLSCVNSVGANLNTASKHLLSYVSGLGPKLAENIVNYRTENGPFNNRMELKKIPRMGAKAFEQCAGFLRIPDGDNPLDNTSVHPESYPIVKQMVKDNKTTLETLIKTDSIRKAIDLNKYVNNKTGLPTLKDIMKELDKPGRDPRQKIKSFEFANNIHKIEDLITGMVVPGLITNITNFGAFVDIGVHQDGLVHISEMADKYISNPEEIVHLNQEVMVKILDVDVKRRRIQLTMKNL